MPKLKREKALMKIVPLSVPRLLLEHALKDSVRIY